MEQNANPQGSSKGLSIAALVCGVLGIVTYFISIGSVSGIKESGEGVAGTIILAVLGLILGLVGIILGAIGMKKAKALNESRGLAIAGLICGIVGTVFAFIGILCVGAAACVVCTAASQYGGLEGLQQSLEGLH
ncbi:MAG: hypothetical protein IIZ56_02150 [Clostridia bacterium]|jgi:amino acid transporter|nr:hypothetical protein [Clostridia bacterium]MBR4659579.1 hypothetical protein [Clostridia bacterium]